MSKVIDHTTDVRAFKRQSLIRPTRARPKIFLSAATLHGINGLDMASLRERMNRRKEAEVEARMVTGVTNGNTVPEEKPIKKWD